MTELCHCIEDGILKLADGDFWLYIPDFDWRTVQKHIGPSPLYDHLVYPLAEGEAEQTHDPSVSLQALVLRFLDIPPEEFSPDVAFTAYGLDSLSAGRLSMALEPFLAITQMQLLGDINLNDLQGRVESQATEILERRMVPRDNRFHWDAINRSGETVVKLVDREGTPLIIVHGASGIIVPFMPLQEQFSSALWAIQTTPETSFDSVHSMASFYFEQIKVAQPTGPYRLAGYSGGSLVTFELARLFETNGDCVVQLAIVDHFPALFVSPIFLLDEESVQNRWPSRKVIKQALDTVCDCHNRDPRPARHLIAQEVTDAFNGLEVRDYIKGFYGVFEKMTVATTRFLIDLVGEHGSHHPDNVRQHLSYWMNQVKAPLTVYVAHNGIGATIPDATPGWDDLGCRECMPNANVIYVDAGHLDIFERKDFAESLEHGW